MPKRSALPAWQVVAGGEEMPRSAGDPPPGRLSGRITIIGLGVAAVTALLLIGPSQGPGTVLMGDDAPVDDTISSISSAASTVVLVAYLAWSWRMASSFQLLTGMEPPMGRVAAVVWWFVPLANLIMPPLFVAGLMRDLAIPGRRRHRWLVPLWWLTYMGSIGAVLVWSFQLVDGVQRSGALETLRELDSGLLVISQVMAAVAAVALIAIVLLVNRNVAIRYQAALQGWPPPPP